MRKHILLAMLATALAVTGCGSDNNDIVINPQPVPSPGTPINPIGRLGTYLITGSAVGQGLNVFRVEGNTGSLTPVAGSPVAAGASIWNVEQPAGRPFVYASGFSANQILGYRLDPATGQLSALPNFPVSTVQEHSLQFTRSGNFLYAPGRTSIDGFSLDPNTGALTRLPGFPQTVAGMTDARTADVDRNDGFLYVTDAGSDSVFSFRIGTNGSLTQVGQIAGGVDPLGIEVDPNNRFVYAAAGDGNLYSYSRNTDGSLSALGTPTRFASAGATAYKFSIDQGFLYVGDGTTRTLNGFSVNNTTGTLTQLPGYPSQNGGQAVVHFPLPITPFLYAGDRSTNRINGFTVQSNGATSAILGSPFTTVSEPTGLAPVVVTY